MNLVRAFQDFKNIYGFCPCCGELFRLSNVTLFARKSPQRTEFDGLDAGWLEVDKKRQRLNDQRDTMQLRARIKGQRAAKMRLRKFLPFFVSHRLNVRDVKVLFDPVDYLAFQGMSAGDCGAAIFIDRRPDSRRREKLHKSLERAISGGNLEWRTVRINDDATITLS